VLQSKLGPNPTFGTEGREGKERKARSDKNWAENTKVNDPTIFYKFANLG